MQFSPLNLLNHHAQVGSSHFSFFSSLEDSGFDMCVYNNNNDPV